MGLIRVTPPDNYQRWVIRDHYLPVISHRYTNFTIDWCLQCRMCRNKVIRKTSMFSINCLLIMTTIPKIGKETKKQISIKIYSLIISPTTKTSEYLNLTIMFTMSHFHQLHHIYCPSETFSCRLLCPPLDSIAVSLSIFVDWIVEPRYSSGRSFFASQRLTSRLRRSARIGSR